MYKTVTFDTGKVGLKLPVYHRPDVEMNADCRGQAKVVVTLEYGNCKVTVR